MFDWFFILIACATTSVWGWQIVTGKLLDRSWHLWTTRQARPELFWTVIAIQSLVVIFLWSLFLHHA
jgi:hypothetical protein